MVTLKSGSGELVLAPEHGGCVSAFRWEGIDILRQFDPLKGKATAATNYAAFPLFPFSGRIANGRFSFQGTRFELPPNFPPEPHAIHGQGWQAAWKVVESSDVSAKLEYKNDGAVWPWLYHAEQHFSLTAAGMSVRLSLTNLSDTAMPAGMGWHPYFASDGAVIETDVNSIWLSGDDMIPASASELSDGNNLNIARAVLDLNLDNAFSAGPKGTTIHWPSKAVELKMTASHPFRHLIVYTPPGEDFFCAEPVSHSPDAVNSNEPPETTGLKVLEAGEPFEGAINLSVIF